MSKELYIAAHERLCAEEMERTGCDWRDAYERTADAAYDAMRDDYADMVDRAWQAAKDGQSQPKAPLATDAASKGSAA